jgi:hypothetical protein
LELFVPRTSLFIRIWNYNKSRIHSYRGARFVEVSLDDCFIFRGEIAKAPGILNGSEESAEGDVLLLLLFPFFFLSHLQMCYSL